MKFTKNHLLAFATIIVVLIAALITWQGARDQSDNTEYGQRKLCEEAATHYISLTETQATAKAIKENRTYRVLVNGVYRNGLEATAEGNSARLNLDTNKKGVVTKVTCN